MTSARDVRTVDEAVRTRHPDPFHDLEPADWAAAVEDLAGRAEGLGDEAFLVELMRLLALFGSRDGHSAVSPFDPRHRRHPRRLPVRLRFFEEGLFDLAGGRVTAIAGSEVDELVRLVSPLVAADNDWSRLARLPDFLACTEVLAGLGLGSPHDATSQRRPAATAPVRPTARGYVDYPRTDSATAAAVARQVVQLAGKERIVLDLRRNGGGDNRTYAPVLEAVAEAAARGGVFVLVGRDTFSAAANFAAEVARVDGVTLVGEPTGGAPNQWGDAVGVALPVSGWTASVATVYHERIPGDTSLTTVPGLAVPLRAADFLAGRDAAVEAAFAA